MSNSVRPTAHRRVAAFNEICPGSDQDTSTRDKNPGKVRYSARTMSHREDGSKHVNCRQSASRTQRNEILVAAEESRVRPLRVRHRLAARRCIPSNSSER